MERRAGGVADYVHAVNVSVGRLGGEEEHRCEVWVRK